MPVQHHTNEDEQFTSLHVAGLVTLNEVEEHLNRVLEDDNFMRSWPQLVDLRAAELSGEVNIEPFIHNIRKVYRPQINASMAVVMDGSAPSDICAEAYRISCNMPDTELFDDYGQAIKWLFAQAPQL